MLTEAELQKIFRETVTSLYGYVSRQTNADRELSEDIVQESFLRAVTSWRQNGAPDEPVAWLKRVAHNLLVSHHRKKKPEATEDIESCPAEQNSTEERMTAANVIRRALSRLQKEQIGLLGAFHIEGKTTREIARELNISERAVEGRLRRARRTLRSRLEEIMR